jgi:hypothetical protein
MKNLKLMLIFVLLVLAGIANAQYVQVIFKDNLSPYTTYNRVIAENPAYGISPNPPLADRWLIQLYETTDDIVSPLDTIGNPTGDDVMITDALNLNSAQYLLLLNATGLVSMSAIRFYTTSQAAQGDKVYLRLFNAHTIAAATKYIQYLVPYTVPVTNANVELDPTYGWTNWTLINPPVLNPAVLVSPANGATGVDFNGINLSWSPGTGIVPDNYKVYFGTDTPPTNIVNGTVQPGTNYATGPLTMNQVFYWQIIPMSGTLEAQNCPIWAFSTSQQINPDPAINPSPVNGATIYVEAFPYDQTLSWSPAATGQAPSGYKLYWNGATEYEDLGLVATTLKNITAAGIYTWKIVPYYIDPVSRKVTDGKSIPAQLGNTRNERGDAINCPTWSFAAAQIQYYTVDINSTPAGAAIYVGGVDSGFTTPYQFSMVQFSSATYTVHMAGYTWAPTQFVVTNITSNLSQNFVGTIQTFNCVITSNPTNADIFVNGVDSGFNTPHAFFMNYGTSATYTVQMAGYTWSPAQFAVNNIQANTNQLFTGTIITYTVDITSTPTNADIFVNGVDSGFNSPHQFVMNYGTGATYTVQIAGYSWVPANFVVTNIQANTSQDFVGTINTYTVNLTSTPTDADIFVNGVDSGFNTPHQFVMNYGTSATYTLQMTGYNWAPPSLVVTNIQTNITQNFVGSLQTFNVNITSTPTNADIYVNGVDSGFNTPHVFVMNYGTSATYTVQMAGYTWVPANFVVTNIVSNLSQNFVGTIITFTVDITSTPTNADIFVNGVDSGFNTPHQFVMNYGASSTYTVQMAGYTWVPANFVITNIQANTSQNFVGSLQTFNVNITSTPTNADIYVNGVDSGFNTPHVFVMNYGTSATYTVQMTGYTWTPPSLVVTNIQANITQNFVGALLTYTVDITSAPTNADIFVNGTDSGFNTPHQFILNYGASATYTVQMAGYTWVPANFVVTNITANTSQNFVGTIITYTVDITSAPSDANIFVNGTDSGFNTPHQFVMNYGTSATYTLQLDGYAFTPAQFVVTNITANMSQNFTGATIYLTLTPETQTVSAVAGTFVFEVASNFSWTITEEVPWFTVSPTSGTGDGSFTVTYQANTSVDPRIGEITVTAGNVIVSAELTQLGYVENEDLIEVPFANISVYPNPFSTNANIKLYVKAGQKADVNIYSVKGQLVKSVGLYNKGIHTVTWNGKDETGRKCSSGFYFIRYQSDGFNKTVKVLLMEN